MIPYCNRLYQLLFVFVLVTLLGGCSFGPLFKSTREIEEPHIPGKGIHVVTANGTISVKRSEGAHVAIVAHLRAGSQERLDETEILTKRIDDGTLSVSVEWPGGSRWSREGCSFEILIPDATNVYLKSSNGGLHVVGLNGEADLNTSNGSITLEDHAGSVDADTSNGRITLTKIIGTIDAETSNGRITITDAEASVKARTSNGKIHTKLTADNAGPIDLRSSNGSIHVEVGPAFSGSLALRTSNGRIYANNLPNAKILSQSRRRAELMFGSDINESKVRTSNGSIRVQALGR